MLRQLCKDTAIYGAGTILVRGASLLLLPLYTRLLTPADYGTADLINAYASFVYVTLALEVLQGLARFLPDVTDEREKLLYTSSAFWFTAAVYTVFVATCLVFSVPLSRLILGGNGFRGPGPLRMALASMLSFGLYSVAQGQFRYRFRAKEYAAVSLAASVAGLVSSVVLIAGLQLGVVGMFGGQFIGNSVGAALSLFVGRQGLGFVVDRARLGEMLRFSIPFVPSSIGVIATLYINRIAINGFMTLRDVGLFGIAARLASIVSLLVFGLNSALTPLIIANYRDPRTADELARLFRVFLFGAALLVVLAGAWARELLVVFTTPAYYDASGLVPFLVASALLSSMYIFAPGLDIAKKTGRIALINLASAGTNTLLSFALIPYLGLVGAALAGLTSAGLMFALYMSGSQRYYPIPHRWPQLALATVVAVSGVVTAERLTGGSIAAICAKVGIVAFAATALVRAGLIHPAELRTVFSAIVVRLRWLAGGRPASL